MACAAVAVLQSHGVDGHAEFMGDVAQHAEHIDCATARTLSDWHDDFSHLLRRALLQVLHANGHHIIDPKVQIDCNHCTHAKTPRKDKPKAKPVVPAAGTPPVAAASRTETRVYDTGHGNEGKPDVTPTATDNEVDM